ncbi:hypothetical protein M404DRAFT_32788 [Pisolithus tinctorius Marx 270]|uniref:Uncharacterized protein n=1 Tax=Pisolithus tinctorius Marx 270 TaxID=870435 RepID=A0A0C3N7B3_PISTI|nr:hypothetical protein M404DRAFT_32788 [Pisolithus tinctorius Marx 270]
MFALLTYSPVLDSYTSLQRLTLAVIFFYANKEVPCEQYLPPIRVVALNGWALDEQTRGLSLVSELRLSFRASYVHVRAIGARLIL